MAFTGIGIGHKLVHGIGTSVSEQDIFGTDPDPDPAISSSVVDPDPGEHTEDIWYRK
jgi:hypothetical protein